MNSQWPNHLKAAIELRTCRHCGACNGNACIDPRTTPVFVTINFDDGPREFCYERIFDYFESHRPPTTEVAHRSPTATPAVTSYTVVDARERRAQDIANDRGNDDQRGR